MTSYLIQSREYFIILSMFYFISACIFLYFLSEIQSPGFLFSKSPKDKDKEKGKDKSKEKDKSKGGKADKDKKDKKNKKKGKGGKDGEGSEHDISSTQTSPEKEGEKETSPMSAHGGGPPQGSPQLPGYTREYDYDADDKTPTGRKFLPQGHGFTYEERDRQNQLLAGAGEAISELQHSPTANRRATGLAFNYAPGEDQKVLETVEKLKLLADKNAALNKDGVVPVGIKTPGLDYVESAARKEQAKAGSNAPHAAEGYGAYYGTEGNISPGARRALDMRSGGAFFPHHQQKEIQPGNRQDSYSAGQLGQYPGHSVGSYDEGLRGGKFPYGAADKDEAQLSGFPYGTGNEQYEVSGTLPSSAAFIAHESGKYPTHGAGEGSATNQHRGYFTPGQSAGEPSVAHGNKDASRPANAAAMSGAAVALGTKSKQQKKHRSGTGSASSSESNGEGVSSSDDLSDYAEGKGEHVRDLQGVAKLKIPKTQKKRAKGSDVHKDLSSPAALTAPKIVKTTTKQTVVKDKEGLTQNIEEKVEDLTPGGTGAITLSTQVNKVKYGKPCTSVFH